MPRALRLNPIALPILLATATALAQPAAPTDCSAYTSIPLPPEATQTPTPTAPPACASYRSYRGLGRPTDLAAARACAFHERLAQQADLGQNQHDPTAWIIGGSLILADIYFNGAGVPRNIPLALRFACEAEPAMAELALPEITKLNGAPPAHPPFEFCDYAATTLTMNFCSGYATEIADDRRTRSNAKLRSSMTPTQQAAFDTLLAAEDAYISTHAFEVYQGGTIRGLRTIGSENILKNLFQGELAQFEHKHFPALSAPQIADADTQLQPAFTQALHRAQAQTPDALADGAVTAENLAKVQHAWEAYRDAWTAFARTRYPAAADAIRALITQDRTRLLRTIG